MTAMQQAGSTLIDMPGYLFARVVGDTMMVHQSGAVPEDDRSLGEVRQAVFAGGGQLVDQFTIPDPEWDSGWVTVLEYRLRQVEEMAA